MGGECRISFQAASHAETNEIANEKTTCNEVVTKINQSATQVETALTGEGEEEESCIIGKGRAREKTRCNI